MLLFAGRCNDPVSGSAVSIKPAFGFATAYSCAGLPHQCCRFWQQQDGWTVSCIRGPPKRAGLRTIGELLPQPTNASSTLLMWSIFPACPLVPVLAHRGQSFTRLIASAGLEIETREKKSNECFHLGRSNSFCHCSGKGRQENRQRKRFFVRLLYQLSYSPIMRRDRTRTCNQLFGMKYPAFSLPAKRTTATRTDRLIV